MANISLIISKYEKLAKYEKLGKYCPHNRTIINGCWQKYAFTPDIDFENCKKSLFGQIYFYFLLWSHFVLLKRRKSINSGTIKSNQN